MQFVLTTTLQWLVLISVLWIGKATEDSDPCDDYYIIETTKRMMISSNSELWARQSKPIVIETRERDDRIALLYGFLAWFKLEGNGGTEVLNHKPNETNICETRHPGWIKGRLPPLLGEQKQADLCFYESDMKPCQQLRKILIHNCTNFLVYKMKEIPDISVIFGRDESQSYLFCTQFPNVMPEKPSPCDEHDILQTTSAMLTTSGYEKSNATDHYYDIRGQYQYRLDDWFRLTGKGGSEILDHEPNGVNICGTPHPGWINFSGKVPTLGDTVEAIVCHKSRRSDCYRSSTVYVRKCENFLVYQFPEYDLVEYPPSFFCTQEPRTPGSVTPRPGTPEPVTDAPGKPEPATEGPGKPGPATEDPGKPGPVTEGPGKPGPATEGPGKPGPATDGPGKPGPTTEGPGKPGPTTEGPGKPGPATEGPGKPGPATDGPGKPGPATEGPGKPGPATEGPGKPGPVTERPGKPGPATDGPGKPGPATDGPGKPGPATEDPGKPEPATDGPGKPGPATEGPGKPGPATEGPGKPGPATEGPGKPGPATEGPGKPGPATDGPGKPGPATDSPGKPGPATEGPGKPGPATEGPGKPGPATEGPGKPGPVTEGPGKPGPATDGPGKPGPATEGPGKPGPATEGPGKPGPATEGPGKPGPATEGPGKPGPATEGPGKPGPATEGPGKPGPATEGPGKPGPATEGPGKPGPATEGPGKPGPATEDPGKPGPATEGPGKPGPTTEGPGKPGPATEGPGKPGPATEGPGKPGPATEGPGNPGPATVGPGKPGPATEGPGKPGPSTEGPGKPGPATEGPGKPGPATEGPGKPGPSTEGPGKPKMCAKRPCGLHGTCYELGLGYECVCKVGFAGRHCETNINECASSPCLYGGMCIDGVDEYKCVCPTGLTGKNCDININECKTHGCQNGGKCVDSVNGYFCFCALGFSGPRCETNENNCGSSNPCRNGGSCRDGVNSYSCECASGFEGKNCEDRISRCRSGPCRNGGTCTDQGGSYRCSCLAGYSGINCETKFIHCDSSPCKNGGKCVSSQNGFSCTCLPGWSGRTCENDKEIQDLVDNIDKTADEDGRFSMNDLSNKIKDALDYLFGKDSNDDDSLTDKIGKKLENSVKNFLKKKFEKAFDKLKSKLPKKCGNFNLGNAVNHFKKGYQNCLNKRRKKCRDEGKKEREENGEEEEEEDEDENENEENENEGENENESENENENEEKNEGCDDECPALADIPHGRYVGSNFDCGHSVTFTCDDGYEMTGCETAECKITCEKGGKWSSEPPTCERKKCGGFITLSPTNPQTTLTIPGVQRQGKSTVDCTWVVITSEQNELNIDFPGSFTSASKSRVNCADHFVELGFGSDITRICQTGRAYHRSFPNMMTVRFRSTDSSGVTFSARISVVKDYYEKASMNSKWGTRALPPKRSKSSCEVQINDHKQFPSNAPIMMTASNEVMFPDDKNSLDLTNSFKASCTTQSFGSLPENPSRVWVECVRGYKVEASYKIVKRGSSTRGDTVREAKEELNFVKLNCKAIPETTVKKSTLTSHKFVWEVDDATVAVIDKIEIDPGNKIPKYASHSLHGKNIHGKKEGDLGRPPFKYTAGIAKGVQIAPDTYPIKDQRSLFEAIDPSLRNKVDCCLDNYLVHGHLVPNADFFYKAWRHATFYMTNVAPQWQAINGGNWLAVENAVRKYAESKKQEMKITTGTHGVLNIDGHDIILRGTPSSPSVPSHFWKVLHDPAAGKAVAFVIVNNPYASSAGGLPDSADQMCPTQCPLLKGKISTTSRGLLMCCSPDDLRKNITHVPIIPGAGDLFASPELENALNVK